MLLQDAKAPFRIVSDRLHGPSPCLVVIMIRGMPLLIRSDGINPLFVPTAIIDSMHSTHAHCVLVANVA